MSVVTRTVQIGIFAVMGFIFVTLAQARPFQATVTTNSQTMGITVTRLPGDNEITDNLPKNVKDHALLSLEENLRIGRYLFEADRSPLSVVNDNTVFQVSLDDGSIGRNQEPVPAGNMTHLLWGVTYCRKYNELMQLPHESLNESDELPVSSLLNTTDNELNPLLDENIHQQNTCLKKYIIQCPTSGQTASQTGLSPFGFNPTNSANPYSQWHMTYFFADNNGDDGTGGNDQPHTFDRSPQIFCPACNQHGCRAQGSINLGQLFSDINEMLYQETGQYTIDHTFCTSPQIHCPACNEFGCRTQGAISWDQLLSDINEVLCSETNEDTIETTPKSDELDALNPQQSGNASIAEPPASSETKVKRNVKRNKESLYIKNPKANPPLMIKFILNLLYTENNSDLVIWVNKSDGVFKVVNPGLLASRWGAQKKRKRPMNWDKMGRAIRYGYDDGKGPIIKPKSPILNTMLVYQVNFKNKIIRYIMKQNKYETD